MGVRPFARNHHHQTEEEMRLFICAVMSVSILLTLYAICKEVTRIRECQELEVLNRIANESADSVLRNKADSLLQIKLAHEVNFANNKNEKQ